MMSSRTFVVIVVFTLLLGACVKGQLTFSPDWGKRSIGVMTASGSGNSPTVGGSGGFFESQQSNNCKTSNEMLLEIFRFVQSEAQLFVDCKHRE